MTRDGTMGVGFNQEMEIPSFITKDKATKARMLAEEDECYKNGTYHPKRPRRTLVAVDEIDINRDVMFVEFFLKSDIKVSDIEYWLEIKNWTAEAFDITINFTNPMIISQGEYRDEV
jgi:hypothetical protein